MKRAATRGAIRAIPKEAGGRPNAAACAHDNRGRATRQAGAPLLGAILILASALVITAAPALAASPEGIHSFLYSIHGEEVGTPCEFCGFNVTGVAVDNSSSPEAGKLYVGANSFDKISRLEPGSSSAAFECHITGAGENSTDPAECAKEGPAVPVEKFQGMFGVAVDPSNGNIYAVDNGFYYNPATQKYEAPHEINMFNSAGVLLKSHDFGETYPNRVAAAPGILYIANEDTNAIEAWEPATDTVSTFSTGAGAPTGSFGKIAGVTVDLDPSSPSYKDVYAVDRGTDEVQSFAPPPAEIGGTSTEYTLTYKGKTTKPIPGTASPEGVKHKLEELPTIHTQGEAAENVEVSQVGSEYRVRFVGNLGTTDVPQLEGEVIEPSPPTPIVFTTLQQGIQPALDKFNEAAEYQCQITGAGEETTSASECSTAKPGILGGRGFDTRGGINGAAAVDPDNGHIYVRNNLVYEPSPGVGYFHSYIDEFSPTGDYLANIESTTKHIIDAYNIAVSAKSHDVFLTNLSQFRVDVYGGDKPLIETKPATNANGSSVVLHGTVNPLGFPVEECEFEYVESAKWKPKSSEPYGDGTSVPCENSIPTDNDVHEVEAHVSGLEAGKFYYFRIVAKNANGTSEGEDQEFGAPYAGTNVATDVEQTSAKLNGVVNPNHGEATYYFEYGTGTSYGTKVPASPAGPLTGNKEQLVSETVSGLEVGTTYHYRLVATNASGTVYGNDHNFNTMPALLIDAISARHQTKSSAILQAYVDPLASATVYHFEYGTSTQYGHSTPQESAGSGTQTSLEEAEVTGLEPETEYHFRTVASNANGTVTGPDQVFLTEPASCPNEARRQEQGNPGMMMPDCRAFERVSPQEKGDAPVAGSKLGTTGEYVLYKGNGLFAGATWPGTPLVGTEYLAHRTADGWRTESIHPTIQQVPLRDSGTLVTTTPDLGESLWGLTDNNLTEYEEATGTALYRRSQSGLFSKVSPPIEDTYYPWNAGPGMTSSDHSRDGENVDLTHMLYKTDFPLIASDPYPAPEAGNVYQERVYDVTLGPSPSLAVVNLTSNGEPMPGCGGGFGYGEVLLGATGGNIASDVPNSSTNYITPDGSVIYFGMIPAGDCFHEGFRAGNDQLYARIDQLRTVPISEPESNEDCTTRLCATSPTSDARFAGASADGSKVFFIDTHPLVDEATEDTSETDEATVCSESGLGGVTGPNGCNLYMYDFHRPVGHNLVDISGGVPPTTAENPNRTGLGPQVKYILRSTPDGSHVYFVARGLLTETPNSLGQRAQQGAENFYDYDTETEKMRFIAEFCSGFEKSGILPDPKCSGNDHFWIAQDFPSSNGKILAFTTYSQITPDDKNISTDVYRYDATSGAIERISIGHDGETDQNGNEGGDALLMPAGSCQGIDLLAECQPTNAINERPMTSDGSTILFGTDRPLQEGDENETEDAYEWHDGQVSLVSGAKSHTQMSAIGAIAFVAGGSNPVISEDGRDITFAMDAGLVEEDNDELSDIYDARVDGGFPPPAEGVPPCHGGESCAGQLQAAPMPPTFGSETLTSPRQEHQCHKGFVNRHHHCVPRSKRHGRHRHRQHGRHNNPRHHRRASAKRGSGR
jgi:hypothetical protein